MTRTSLKVKARKECPDLMRGKCLENLKRSKKCERGIFSECCFFDCGRDCFQLCPKIVYITNLVKKDEEAESKRQNKTLMSDTGNISIGTGTIAPGARFKITKQKKGGVKCLI
ncbi:MAG: hypothetical protein DDT23_01284 [candidate division WS2 bacterium]|nr:hypothetical protein [Candidatus Lithacetigena glycinireducens]